MAGRPARRYLARRRGSSPSAPWGRSQSSWSIEVLLTRAQDYVVKANIFRAPALFALQSIASSGRVTGNHFSGVGTGAIFAGGYPESPSSVVFTGNRAVGNTTGGLLLNGVSINLPE